MICNVMRTSCCLARWKQTSWGRMGSTDTSLTLPASQLEPPPYQGPSKETVLKLRQRYLSPGLFLHFKAPVMIVGGRQQYLFDERGTRYLDAFAGIVTVSVGHCHPNVNAAICEQMSRLQHTTTIYLNDQIALYGQELAQKMPGDLKVAYFVNSGSEANDLALLMARVYTGSQDVVCLRNAYHGVSLGTMAACGHSTWRHNLGSAGMLAALNPDPYRGRLGNDGPAYAEDVKDLIMSASSGRVAGFMAETIQGVGGAVPLADGYLPAAYEIIRAAGGVCIADEVQTGFGRTGDHYWGFERQGVIPDIVTMAKGIGNGFPLAAVMTTPKIAATLSQRLHLNTFGGNPVSCAAGRAVLRVIEAEGMQAHCKHQGEYLLKRLRSMQEKHSIIGDVRGAGLMLGVELVKDRQSKEPAAVETAQVMELLKDKYRILIGKGGLYGNVFRIKPPMCLLPADTAYLCDALDEALSSL